MKNLTFRRLAAYLIDLVIIGILGTCFSFIPVLQKNEVEYEKMYQEVVQLYDSYSNNEITMSEYQEKYISLSYDMNRANYLYTIIQMLVIILYFTIVPYFMYGQTLGKKVLNIRVVSSISDERVGIISYFLRSIIQNNILITIAQVSILFIFTKENYYTIYNNVNMVGYILLYFIVFLVLIRKDSRGLHDLLSGTQVVLNHIDEKSKEEEKLLIEEKEDFVNTNHKEKVSKTKEKITIEENKTKKNNTGRAKKENQKSTKSKTKN